jgi:hypothetical protein
MCVDRHCERSGCQGTAKGPTVGVEQCLERAQYGFVSDAVLTYQGRGRRSAENVVQKRLGDALPVDDCREVLRNERRHRRANRCTAVRHLRTVSWTSVGSEVRASCSTTLSRKSALVLNLRKNVAVDESDAWTTSSMRIPRSRIRRGSATNSVTAASTKWVAVASSSFMGTDFTEVRPTVTVPVTVLTLG